jgi:hypothetical protein
MNEYGFFLAHANMTLLRTGEGRVGGWRGLAGGRRVFPQRHMGHMARWPRARAQGRADGADGANDDDILGDMFQKELQKRNISSIDDIADSASDPSQPKSTNESPRPQVVPPPQYATGWGPRAGANDDYDDEEDGTSDQLRRSRALGSEGLDGLIPRGSQLLTLGATSFLAFGPFILFVLVSFGAVYMVFGDMFVHGGAPSTGVPTYYDPIDLLSEPTADPMIPM